MWINKHTSERTVIKDFRSRTERIPDPRGGFMDEHQLVVHHTANVPPGYSEGYGDDAVSFIEHWRPQTLQTDRYQGVVSPHNKERPRDVGAPGAAT